MSDEITFRFAASLRNGLVRRDLLGSFKVDQINKHVNRFFAQPGTSFVTLLEFDIISGYWFLFNLGNDLQATDVTIKFGPIYTSRRRGGELFPGQWAFFPIIPGKTIGVVGSDDTNRPRLIYEIWGL